MNQYLIVMSLCLLTGCAVSPKIIREIDIKEGQVTIIEHHCSSDPFAPCP